MRKMGPGTYPQAISFFNRAIAIWPEFADAYLSRGIAEHNLGQTHSASIDLEKSSDLNPNLTRAYDERGRMYLEKGDTRRAIDEFTKSLHIQPTTDGYYARGLAYEAAGEHQKAVADYDDAIAEMRDAPYAYRARALAKDALLDVEGAKADRETAQRIESR
jgi:tetratricopeptide (TPR) repeat protein